MKQKVRFLLLISNLQWNYFQKNKRDQGKGLYVVHVILCAYIFIDMCQAIKKKYVSWRKKTIQI